MAKKTEFSRNRAEFSRNRAEFSRNSYSGGVVYQVVILCRKSN
ncbi:MAG: hypothetical protein ACRCZY_03335 [Phocaeicola sp.]